MGRCLFASCYAMPSRNVEAPRPPGSRERTRLALRACANGLGCLPACLRGSPLGTADGAKSPKRPQPRGGNAQPRAFVKSVEVGRRSDAPGRGAGVPRSPGLGPAQDRRMPRSDVAGASPRSVVTCSGFPHAHEPGPCAVHASDSANPSWTQPNFPIIPLLSRTGRRQPSIQIVLGPGTSV